MRRTDYLFLRPGSRNWHVKLQSPTGRVERSLGTADRVQAEILALPMIAEHKVKLLEARPRLETIWKHEFEPDREHIGPDGDRSGGIEARTGLRMMPTFPRSPLSFRTAGFPQYGWKAGVSDETFPARQSA